MMENKLHAWEGKLMPYGGRLLFFEILFGQYSFVYVFSIFLPKGPSKCFSFFMKRLLWSEMEGVKKYHLVNWETVCQPLDQDGLAVVDLEIMNICLISKWLWK
jgi:hypothetical protein